MLVGNFSCMLLYRVPLNSDSIFMKSFNTCSIDFINNISQLYPLSKDEKISLKLIEALNRLNPTVVTKVRFPNVYDPHETFINTGYITFLINKDYSEEGAFCFCYHKEYMFAYFKIFFLLFRKIDSIYFFE